MNSSHVKFLKAGILRYVFIKDKFKNIVTSESKKKKNPHNLDKNKNSQWDGKPNIYMENDKKLIQNQ